MIFHFKTLNSLFFDQQKIHYISFSVSKKTSFSRQNPSFPSLPLVTSIEHIFIDLIYN